MENKVDIYVATHKKIKTEFPECFHKIRVNSKGKESWEGYLRDDEGDNISEKNYCYCELTALYSLWKNSDADIKGLFHYRRILGNKETVSLMDVAASYMGILSQETQKMIIKEDEIIEGLSNCDLILPFDDCPFGLIAFEDLLRFVYIRDVNTMIDVIEEMYPEYTDAMWYVLKRHHISYCNMFIARSDISDAYCKWLFDVLSEIEKRVDISEYDNEHKRIFGYLSEVLLNVYIRKNELRVKRLNYLVIYERDLKGKISVYAKRVISTVMACMGAYPPIRGRIANRAKHNEFVRYLKGDMSEPRNDSPVYDSPEKMLIKAGAGKIYRDDNYLIVKVSYKEDRFYIVICETEDAATVENRVDGLNEYCERLREEYKLPKHFVYPRILYYGTEDIDEGLDKSIIRNGVVPVHMKRG